MTSRRRRDAGGMSAADDRLAPAGGSSWLPLSNREPLSRPGHYDDAPEQAHQSQDLERSSGGARLALDRAGPRDLHQAGARHHPDPVTFGRHNYSKVLAKQLNLRHAMRAVRR